MKRAIAVVPAGSWPPSAAIDAVLLDFDRRHRRRIALRTIAGAELLLDLPQPVHLRDGDGLALQDGGIVRVSAEPEPVLEIRAPDEMTLLRIAWHLGNRHLPVQVFERQLRIRSDHVIAAMVAQLGALIAEIDAPFDPEPGAYTGGHHYER